MWILHALAGRLPIVHGAVGPNAMRLEWRHAGAVFEAPPVIAIEDKYGGKYVRAVGQSADGMSGLPTISLHKPFESMEPLFADYDAAVALVRHAIREIFGLRWMMAPRLALRLDGRSAPLSGKEKIMLQGFAYDCGIARLYVFLSDQVIPLAQDMSQTSLAKTAHFATKFKV